MRALLALAALGACSAAPDAAPEIGEPPMHALPVRGIDHLPVAVRDLEAAAANFRALGFTLKPGRAHDNGIRNLHAKFADGTSIELITAPAAVDALSADYRSFLEAGEGPAFLALFAPDATALRAKLAGFGARIEAPPPGFVPGDPLHPFFFGHRERSPTDRPEHFAHANGATGLVGVWIADGAVRELLAALELPTQTAHRCAPDCADREIVPLDKGELLLLPAAARSPRRAIVGATVRVRSIAAVDPLLPADTIRHGASRFVRPVHANGLWLELREGR